MTHPTANKHDEDEDSTQSPPSLASTTDTARTARVDIFAAWHERNATASQETKEEWTKLYEKLCNATPETLLHVLLEAQQKGNDVPISFLVCNEADELIPF